MDTSAERSPLQAQNTGDKPPSVMSRAMRRIVSTPHGKLTFEKMFYLNMSRSRRLVLGLDLERDLQPFGQLDNGTGLGVRLGASDLRALLSDQWCQRVRNHMRTPVAPPGASKVCENVDFRLTLIRDLEPGLKITMAGDASLKQFIVLGQVTCQKLLNLAPAILYHLESLEKRVDAAKVMLELCLTMLQNNAYKAMYETKGDETISNERQARELITQMGPKLCRRDEEVLSTTGSISDGELEFMIDLLFKYPETLARMLYDLCDKGTYDVCDKGTYDVR